ncbi:hypothetical protein HELRODRAFT_188094 [Helobdella robusta]|uniref:Uncharacterized protein n=1 Tax=Helobdella robusta TaxID=6412 RepID=T1FPM4_HELRO|nr:hypothetical protein HELRODRAFT_188094 [Helobdella robusta]ESO13064.1 hypothetical protein HELRODRAFT_188094 [Helobdella robusta]
MPLSFNFDKKEVDKYLREESDEADEYDDDGDDDVSKLVDIPQTPKLVLRDDEEKEHLTPDLEENVCRQTGHVMDSFFATMNSKNRLHDADFTDAPLRHPVSYSFKHSFIYSSCSFSFIIVDTLFNSKMSPEVLVKFEDESPGFEKQIEKQTHNSRESTCESAGMPGAGLPDATVQKKLAKI